MSIARMGFVCPMALVSWSVGACHAPVERAFDAQGRIVLNILSLNSCDVDIRPIDGNIKGTDKLKIRYFVEEAKTSLELTPNKDGSRLYALQGGKLVDLGPLAKDEAANVTITWTGAKSDQVIVEHGAYVVLNAQVDGVYDAGERRSSPRIELEDKDDWVRFRCSYRGHSTPLVVR